MRPTPKQLVTAWVEAFHRGEPQPNPQVYTSSQE